MSSAIRELIRQRLAPLQALHCVIEDDSAQHAGHGGWREDGSHFSLIIVSAQFAGLMRMKRHRLVYDCLHDLMKERVHALALTTLAPDEWQSQQQ